MALHMLTTGIDGGVCRSRDDGLGGFTLVFFFFLFPFALTTGTEMGQSVAF